MVSAKNSLLLITRLDTDIVKFLAYVQLGEVLHILKFYDKLRD